MGTNPYAVAIGDFNGDGNLDLAVANGTSNNVSVLLGNGDGTFQKAVNYGVGSYPISVLVGDFNGDAKLDLAVANATGGSISILLGNGDGTFEPPVDFIAPYPVAMAAANFNGGSGLDLAAADEFGVSIFLNTTSIQPVPPAITSANDTTFRANVAGSFIVTASGLPAPALSETGTLPAGVTFTGRSNGTALLAGSTKTGGAYPITITASNGAGNNATQSFTLMVNQEPKIISAPNATFAFDTPGSFTVTTAGYPPPALTETGSLPSGVTFTDNKNGTATLAGSAAAQGKFPITIMASNGVGNAASQNFKLSVSSAPTSTALTISPNPSEFGQSVTFTATVTSAGGIPGGSVAFKSGNSTLGTGTLNASGQATLMNPNLGVGSHSITAAYGGSAEFTASVSAPTTLKVDAAPTSTAIASSLNPSSVGQSVTFTATVTSATGVTVTGTVRFKSGSTVLGTGPLNASGVATFATTSLPSGSNSITATYEASADFLGSTSRTLTQVVNKNPTTTAVTSSLNPSKAGQLVTFTATVTSTAAGTPTGSVTFKDGSKGIGSGTLNASGQATFGTATLTKGTHNITAVYAGDANFAISTSPVLVQTVN